MCRPGQYSAEQGVTCASCEKGQTDLDGQATQDLYLSGRLPLVAGECMDTDGFTLLPAITDQASCIYDYPGGVETASGRTWTTPTPQCLTHWVTGTCTRSSGNTWTATGGPCLDSNGLEVVVTRPGETLTTRQLEAMCTLIAVPIYDQAGCVDEEGTWNDYEYCAPAQTDPDDTGTRTADDETTCEAAGTGNTFVAASCTEAGSETAHSTEDACEYEPTGNSWDASAAAGAECLDASGSVLASQPADEDTCVRQASGRSWDGLGTTNAPVLLSQDQSTATWPRQAGSGQT